MKMALDDIINLVRSFTRAEQEKLLRELLRLAGEESSRQDPVALSQSYYEAFKKGLKAQFPELEEVPAQEAEARLEELSAKIREKLPFETWQEAQAFMRGAESYDFERQQYIHH